MWCGDGWGERCGHSREKDLSEASSSLLSEDRLSTTTAMNFGIRAITID